jgi:DNA polymerase I-like protein with 3'-5' exonuclease and polymerase domains
MVAIQQSFLTDTHIDVDRDALARALAAPVVAIDVETDTQWKGIGPKKDFGLSYSADITHIALVWQEGKEPTGTVLAAPFDDETLAWLVQLVKTSHTLVAHNAVFDFRQISRLTDGKIPDVIWDTQVMARLLHPAIGASYDLLSVAHMLGVETAKVQRETKGKRAELHKLPADQVIRYVLADALVTYQIYQRQQALAERQVLGEDGLTYQLVEWEMRAVRAYCKMAAQGIRLNVEHTRERILALSDLMKHTAKNLAEDGLFNANSPAERVKYIYEKKGIPKPDPDENPEYFTATGGLSAKDEVIQALIAQFPEHAEKLHDLALYANAKWTQSLLTSLLDHSASDGRLHSVISIATATDRRASSNPNMQNWKMQAPENDIVGSMAGTATADDGFTLVEIDYSNAENWMAALLSGDNNLAAACAAEDFHSAMAAQYFGKAWEQADAAERKRLRRLSKILTFGTAYGMGPAKLAQNLGISVEEAKRLLASKDRAFPAVAETKQLAEEKSRSSGHIDLWTGRRVPVNPEQLYTAWNYLCQGGVAEMLKRAIVLISEEFEQRGWRSRVALDIHDAIVLEIDHAEWDEALARATWLMEHEILPGELNARTVPEVRWIAQPDLAENDKKWGRFQWHPEVVHSEAPKGSQNVLPTSADLVTPAPSEIPLVEIRFEDLHFTWKLKARRGVKFSQLTRAERGEIRAFLVSLWNRLDLAFCEEFTAHLPVRDAKGLFGVGAAITVDLNNHAKIPLAWLQAANLGADTVDLVGMTAEELQAEAARRRGYIDLLDRRVRFATDWIVNINLVDGAAE